MAKKDSSISNKKQFTFSQVGDMIDKIADNVGIRVEKEEKKISYISTGIYILNACLSGSIYKGMAGDRITAFAGPEATGKTYLTLNSAREAQRMGYHVIYIDTENSIELGSLKAYGIDVSVDKFRLIKTNNVEDINITINQLVESMKKAKMDGYEIPKLIMYLDSLGNMTSRKEINDLRASTGELKTDMTKSKALGLLFRSIVNDLGYLNIPLIVNNQTYQTMDLFPQEVMRGGSGLKYNASTIIYLSKAKLKTGEEDDNDIGQSGIVVTAKAVKNRMAKPKKVKFEISFETGSNPYKGLDLFCREEFFDTVGVAKGKMVIDKTSGEETFEGGGNRWFVKHLGKHVATKELFTARVFTKEVLDAIDVLAQEYFRYKSYDEMQTINAVFEEEGEEDTSASEFQQIDLDELDSSSLFEKE